MREPFTKHAALLSAARRWEKAQQLHSLAVERRRDDIRASLKRCTADQVARAFGLSPSRVREIKNEGGR